MRFKYHFEYDTHLLKHSTLFRPFTDIIDLEQVKKKLGGGGGGVTLINNAQSPSFYISMCL